MSFGEELRRERELRHISLREIAQATKIDVRRLEALEQNDFERLPSGLYRRGYIRAYCEHIGVDAEAMVNAYLLEERTRTADGRGDDDAPPELLRGSPESRARLHELSAQIEREGRAEQRLRRRWVVAVILAVVVLAAGALAVVWFAASDDAARMEKPTRADVASRGANA